MSKIDAKLIDIFSIKSLFNNLLYIYEIKIKII